MTNPITESNTTTPIPQRPCNVGIENGQCIFVNEIVYSCKGCFKLILQDDGNLVVYTTVNPIQAIWATNTRGKGGVQLCMQFDGNLVLYTADKVAIWSTSTYYPGAYAEMQSDGQLAIWHNGIVRYSTGISAKCLTAPTNLPDRKGHSVHFIFFYCLLFQQVHQLFHLLLVVKFLKK